MAEDKRISELSPIPTVTPGALFPVVDEITGETMHARFDQMAATVDLDDYALKTYVDAQDIATLDDAKDYADLQDVTNLNAAKAYADGLVVGLWDDRGNFNASVNAYPSTGGSGTAGAIKKGDIWTVSVAGILPSSQSVEVGDTVRALVDTPGNIQANWSIQQNNIGYTAENSANKTNTVAGNETSTTLYASVKGFVDYLVGMTWLTSTIFGAWIVGNTAKTTPVDGDSILISDLSDGNKTKKTTLTELWTNYIKPLFLGGGTLTGALNYAPIVTVASASNVDIVNIAGNTAYITGTTGIATFTAGTSGMIRRVQFASALVLQGGNNIRLPNLASTLTTTANDVGTFVYNSTASIWYCVSYTRGSASSLTTNRFTYFNGTDIVTTNHIVGNDGNNITWVNDAFQTFGSGLNYIKGGTTSGVELSSQADRKVQIMCGTTSRLRVEGNDILLGGGDHYFQNYSGTVQYGRLNTNGLLIGTGTINASAQLHLQSVTKGIGLNLVPNASKPTGLKGNFLMNDTNSVLEFTTGTGANWQELAVYKFDELLQITDCNATFSTANTGVYFPFVPKCDMNVTKIFYNLQSAGTDTVRVAIYSDSSNTPTTLLVQSSESTTGATTIGQRSITIASTRLLAQTRYWIAIKNDNGASSFLSKNNVYSNNITREGFTSGAFVGSPAPSSAVNAVWVGIGI